VSISNGYTTAEAIKANFRVQDTDDDGALDLAIEAASRAIDLACNRRFFLDSVTSARTYLLPGAYAPGVFYIDDFDPGTAPTVKVDVDDDGTFETTWTAGTDYQLEPLVHNAVESGPQNAIRLLGSQYLRPAYLGRANLQVTAKWGWPAVPSAIKKACEVLAVDLFRAKDAPFGIGGAADFGVFRVRENQIVKGLILPYVLPAGIA
jgi:hypothetical protein